MYWLRTLGGCALERNGTPLDQVGTQRKALALLAVLAAQGSTGREPLMALFWPESDAERAKGSLKQTIHLLRRQLGAADLLLGTAELRLNPQRIESNVQLFARAPKAGDAATAVAHYGGPFLDGMHLDGAPEFERWLDEERAELARRYADGPRASASRASCSRHGRVAVSLMTALEAAGERAAALRHARIHETLLREELGIAPDPAVAALADRLRSSSAAKSPRPESPTSSPQLESLAPPEPGAARVGWDEPELPSRDGERPARRPEEPAGAPQRVRPYQPALLALLAMLGLAGAGAGAGRRTWWARARSGERA